MRRGEGERGRPGVVAPDARVEGHEEVRRRSGEELRAEVVVVALKCTFFWGGLGAASEVGIGKRVFERKCLDENLL